MTKKRLKFYLNGHNFSFSHSISIKITFSESSHHYLSNDIICLVSRRSEFSYCFSNDVIVAL